MPLARPTLQPQDPLTALVPGEVPERRRFCSSCDAKLRRDAGFCPKCGQEYSFVPTLKPGDVVGGKYEIKGTMAFGGLGWIYLAHDTVLGRWVVLKGLLNAKDPRLLEVAVKEREFLAAVKHPNIVGIYDFVTHGSEGFIVMEHVNGRTLMALRKEKGGPLPPTEAIAYILEVLPAFAYLDELGLVYCDFKPDNVMVEEDTVKLIDLGAVRRVDESGGDVYGSRGYTAPEAHDAPTPLSDLYSVARALAVLVANFEFQGKYEASLPPPDEVEVFREHPSLYRFLRKATRDEPAARFGSASEMAEQLLGVLREVAGDSLDLGRLESALFEGDGEAASPTGRTGRRGVDEVSSGVPRPRVLKDDPAAATILAAGAVADPARRRAMFARALAASPGSLELRLRLIDEDTTLGRFAEAEKALAEVQAAHPDDWRLSWYRGRWLLAQGKLKETQAAFAAILEDLPGEVAPRQALGRACEAAGEMAQAAGYYESVLRVDPGAAGAAFGLARCCIAASDRVGAQAAYRRVPPTSPRYGAAQAALARALVAWPGVEPTAADIEAAADAVTAVASLSDGLDVHLLRAELFAAAASVAAPSPGAKVLDVALDPRSCRLAAEHELRQCARAASSEQERVSFVDAANRVRPWTLL